MMLQAFLDGVRIAVAAYPRRIHWLEALSIGIDQWLARHPDQAATLHRFVQRLAGPTTILFVPSDRDVELPPGHYRFGTEGDWIDLDQVPFGCRRPLLLPRPRPYRIA